MTYNHGKAEKIFKEKWEKTKSYYRANGMTEAQIESMLEFERDVFNSDRTFYEGSVELFDNEESKTLETKDIYINDMMHDWPEMIGDMEIYEQIMAMPEIKRTAYGLYRIGGYTQKQISSLLTIPQQTLSRWIIKIAEILKFSEENG